MPVVGQFLLGFFVIILSFAGALNILYGNLGDGTGKGKEEIRGVGEGKRT